MCQPLSYVDDWQVLVAAPHGLQPVFHCLEQFTQALDLQLDQKKTHVWSISSVGRKILRQQGFGTVAFSKSLGLTFSSPNSTPTAISWIEYVVLVHPGRSFGCLQARMPKRFVPLNVPHGLDAFMRWRLLQ